MESPKKSIYNWWFKQSLFSHSLSMCCFYYLFFVILFLSSWNVSAITLEEVQTLALQNAAELAEAQSYIDEADSAYLQIKSKRLPQLTATSNNRFDTQESSMEFEAPISYDPQTGKFETKKKRYTLGQRDTYNLSLTSRIPLYTGNRLTQETLLASKQREVVGIDKKNVEFSIRKAVSIAYLDYLLGIELYSIAMQNVENATSHTQVAQARFEAQVVKKLDVNRAAILVTGFQQDALETESLKNSARIRLESFLGISLNNFSEPEESFLKTLPDESLGQLLTIAKQHSLERKKVIEMIDLLYLQRKVIQSSQRLQADFSLSSSYATDSMATSRSFTFDATGILSLTLSLFDARQTKYSLAQNQAQLTAMEFRLKAIDTSIKRDIELLLEDQIRIKKELILSDLQVQQTQQALSLAEIEYATGTTDSLSVVDSRIDSAQAMTHRVRLFYHYWQDQFELEQRTGRNLFSLTQLGSTPMEK